MKQLRIVSFWIIFLSMVTAVACAQSPPSSTTNPLPPTTTPIPIGLGQDISEAQPETAVELTATPTITATATVTRTVTAYTVQPGDTLVTIGNRFAVSVTEIAEINNLTNPNAIAAGQTLLIPQEVSATAVPPTDTPPPTHTPIPEATDSDSGAEETAVPPDDLEPTGRLEVTHPLTMAVDESGVITVEIIADPELATIGEHEPHVTGVVRIDASYDDGERAYYEQTVALFPLMSAELNAPAFDVFPSGGDNVRLPRVISTTLPAVWTWDIIATAPGETQVITLNLYKESNVPGDLPFLTQSVSRNIQVTSKSRWSQMVDGLAANVLVLLGTGGPLGLALAFLTYRATRENEQLKREVATYKNKPQYESREEESEGDSALRSEQ